MSGKNLCILSLFLPAALALFPACRGLPPAAPGAGIVFDHIEASGPDALSIHVRVRADNPRGEDAVAEIVGSRLLINGAEVAEGCGLEAAPARLPARSSGEIPAVFRLDMKRLKPPLDEDALLLAVKSEVRLGFAWSGGARGGAESAAEFEFPVVREPLFSIYSIAILQSELVNTRLRLRVRVRNPNPFPITLSSFNYELYGLNYLWGAGKETFTFIIPEYAEAEKNFYIVMNFMETSRELLDRVTAMRSVPYRLSGNAEFAVDLSYLPVFTADFDLSGNSEVLR